METPYLRIAYLKLLLAAALLLFACNSDDDASDAGPDGGPSSASAALTRLSDSRDAWNELMADSGDTYWIDEENCGLRPPPSGYVTAIQVQNGDPRLLERFWTQCTGGQRRYDDFQPRTMPELYDECRMLLVREPTAVLEIDDRGIVQECTYVQPNCMDSCSEGFYILAWDFGERPPERTTSLLPDGGLDAGR